MAYYNYDKDKVEKDYQKLLTLYERANDKEKLELYSELRGFLLYVKEKKVKIEPPYGYEAYRKNLLRERRELIRKYNDLTNILMNNWYASIVNTSSEHIDNFDNLISREEFEKRIILFFDEYFKDDREVVSSTFTGNKLYLKKILFDKRQEASIRYFYPLNDYYIKMTSGYKLNESMVQDMVHELGHVVHFQNMRGNNINNIFGELLSTLYEAKYMEIVTNNNNGNLRSEQVHLIKRAGKIAKLYEEANYIDATDFLTGTYGFDLLKRLYAHIIYLTLYERGNTEYMKAITTLKENSDLDPLEQLAKIDITEDDLIKTSGNARKILTGK